MPLLGLGLYKATADDEAENAIISAAKNGYRLFDTASAYKNEESVGRGIARCGVPRKDLFITTKIWNNAQRLGDVDGAFERSLDRLGLDYIDLYLIHWPVPGCYLNTWKEMEKFLESGRVLSIGVSNFEIRHLEELRKVSGIIPAVNRSNAILSAIRGSSLNTARQTESRYRLMLHWREALIWTMISSAYLVRNMHIRLLRSDFAGLFRRVSP